VPTLTETGLTKEEAKDAFELAFLDQVESGYTADIACCDACYAEFVALWPLASVANNHELERAGISLSLFYENSRLPELYSKEEFEEFSADLTCPRCLGPLGPNMWPYNFPFNVAEDFEDSVKELGVLGQSTPFLLLSSPFAQETLELVRRVSASLAPTDLYGPLYRGRVSNTSLPAVLGAFGKPPPAKTHEGRYNHAGSPVLYLSSDFATCVEELRGKRCSIAEIEFKAQLKILDLVAPDKAHPDFYDELSALTYSALMSAKQPDDGWHKPAYVFSRFISDCCRRQGIHGIKYPSTHIAGTNYNLVIVDPDFDLHAVARLLRVTEWPSDSSLPARE
jgi:RES domain-containing protein